MSLMWRYLVRTLVSVLSAAGLLVAVAGCSGGGSDTPATPTVTTVTETAPPPAGTVPPATSEAPAAPQGSQSQWAMPNLVGSTLQDAQDQIQALTASAVFFTTSHDLSGDDRNQVLDANWEVCTQNIAPGAPITPDSTIDFGVVKIGEGCP